VPIALAAVRTTSHILAGRPFERYAHWVWLSAATIWSSWRPPSCCFDVALQE